MFATTDLEEPVAWLCIDQFPMSHLVDLQLSPAYLEASSTAVKGIYSEVLSVSGCAVVYCLGI